MSYLEKKANEFARTTKHRFEEIVKKYVSDDVVESDDECKQIYNSYKHLFCVFDNVLKLSFLFENENELYNIIHSDIKNARTIRDFKELYRNVLGQVYKILMGVHYKRLSLIEKVKDSNETVKQLEKCVESRIKYHFYCRRFTKKYNVETHEHEILVSIYMYRKILKVQQLLNTFTNEYSDLKEKIRRDLEDDYVEMDTTSDLSNPYELIQKLNSSRRKRS